MMNGWSSIENCLFCFEDLSILIDKKEVIKIVYLIVDNMKMAFEVKPFIKIIIQFQDKIA